MKVSRGLKEQGYHIAKAREKIEQEKGRDATLEEISKETGLSTEEILMATEANREVSSLSPVSYTHLDGIGEDAVSVVIPGAVVYIPLEDLVDFEKEKERLKKEQEHLKKELARSKGMLSNEKFLSKATEAKVLEEKEKLAKYEQMMQQVEERLSQMKSVSYTHLHG